LKLTEFWSRLPEETRRTVLQAAVRMIKAHASLDVTEVTHEGA
jgi:hypothetical protein